MSQWKALEVLHEAHQAGLAKLDRLSSAIEGLKAGKTAPLRELYAFFNGDMRRHFAHEEEALFPAVSRAIGPLGPVRVMIDEHKSLWQAIDSLEEELDAIDSGAGQDVAGAQRIASYILWGLRSHIQKEEEMLFPLALAQLGPAERDAVTLGIAGLDAGRCIEV